MLTSLFASLALVAATPDLGQLLDRLGQTSAQMDVVSQQLSQTCTDRSENLNDDGQPEQVFVETTRTEWVRGVQVKAIHSATEDGKDVTAREQEKLAADQDAAKKDAGKPVQERGNYGGIDYANPFAPDAQGAYRFSLAPVQPDDGRLVRLRFAPRGASTPTLNQGEALVDPRDGMLLSISAHPSDYPTFVDFVRFQARYARSAVGPVLTHFSVEGAGGFLFVHKHYRETLRCAGFSNDAVSRR
jgi:hypothetical protein